MALQGYSEDKKTKVVLEEYPEGFYVYVFVNGEKYPSKDHLQNTLEIAQMQAHRDYFVEPKSWEEIEDLYLHGNH